MKPLVRFAFVPVVAVFVWVVREPASAEPPPAPSADVRFNRDIRPILSNHCFKCHGPDLKKGGLDLQNRDAALKTLKSGNVAFVPGKAKESQLIERVSAGADDPRHMPPKGERLKPEQIAKLT